MDLPPELRKMVYEELFSQPGKTEMDQIKPVGQPRRPCRPGFEVRKLHEGMKWDSTFGKWIGQTPSHFSLLRVSKQLFKESAPVAYGGTFDLPTMGVAAAFFPAIGSMGEYLRHIDLSGYAHQKTKLRTVFRGIGNASALRSIGLPHTFICSRSRFLSMPMWAFLEVLRPFLLKMHKNRKDVDTAVQVLDLFHIKASNPCRYCKDKIGRECINLTCCETKCTEQATHDEETVLSFRQRLATVVGVTLPNAKKGSKKE